MESALKIDFPRDQEADFFVELMGGEVVEINGPADKASVLDNRFQQFHMDTIKKIIRVDRREICFLKFILEAYDGIATMTTIDARQGIVLLRIAPGCEREVEALLCDLGKEFMIDVFAGSRNSMINEHDSCKTNRVLCTRMQVQRRKH